MGDFDIIKVYSLVNIKKMTEVITTNTQIYYDKPPKRDYRRQSE